MTFEEMDKIVREVYKPDLVSDAALEAAARNSERLWAAIANLVRRARHVPKEGRTDIGDSWDIPE